MLNKKCVVLVESCTLKAEESSYVFIQAVWVYFSSQNRGCQNGDQLKLVTYLKSSL